MPLLTINTHQMQRLDAHFEDELIGLIRVHIRTYLPEEYEQLISHDAQNTVIRQAIKTGQQYNLTTDANLTIFTDFRLIFGLSFPEGEEWASSILESDYLTEDEKTVQLTAYLDTYSEADIN